MATLSASIPVARAAQRNAARRAPAAAAVAPVVQGRLRKSTSVLGSLLAGGRGAVRQQRMRSVVTRASDAPAAAAPAPVPAKPAKGPSKARLPSLDALRFFLIAYIAIGHFVVFATSNPVMIKLMTQVRRKSSSRSLVEPRPHSLTPAIDAASLRTYLYSFKRTQRTL